MAIFRKVHTQIWSDPFFSELDSDKKIFYLYLLTNERTKQCGIYEISKRHIAFDLHISIDKVNKLIEYFSSIGKIRFSDSTNELAIKNWAKYNYSTSPKVLKCIESELKLIKNRVLIEYIYSMDTLSQEEEEEEEEEEQEQDVKKPTKNVVDVDAFLNWFNLMKEKYTGVKGKFSTISKTTYNNLKNLKKENLTPQDWEHAFKMMCMNQWVIENKMQTPPHFLANDNFFRYLNQQDAVVVDENNPEAIAEMLRRRKEHYMNEFRNQG